MTESEVRKIAQDHIDQNNLDLSLGITYVLKEAFKVVNGYYFDYTFERIIPGKPDDLPMMLGAPGFMVTSEGKIEVISMGKLRELRAQNPDIH